MKNQEIVEKETRKLAEEFIDKTTNSVMKLSKMCFNKDVSIECFLNMNIMIIKSFVYHFYANQLSISGLEDYDKYKDILFNSIEDVLKLAKEKHLLK